MLALAAFRDFSNISGACMRTITGILNVVWARAVLLGVVLGPISVIENIQFYPKGSPSPRSPFKGALTS